MTTPALDVETQYGLFLDLLDQVLLAPDRAYMPGEVPGADGNDGTLPDRYVVLTVHRTFEPPVMLDASEVISAWAVTARCFGRTRNEANRLLTRAMRALGGERVVVDGVQSTPLTYEPAGEPGFEDGTHFVDAAWTYKF